jgi:NAD+ synthase
MTSSLKIALAQLNPKVGDVAGNLAKVRAARAEASKQGADLMLTAELVLAGYFPEDLVLKPSFVKRCHEAVEELRADTKDGGPALFVATPWREDGKLYNAIIGLDKGEIIGKRYKVDLPNYGVFDDKRVFAPGPMPGPLVVKGVRIGVPICEDVWTPDVVECISETGGEILLVPNASPYEIGKTDVRVQLAVSRVVESGLPLVYLNQVGGQDEVIYDGGSFALGADRSLKARLASFREQVSTIEFRRNGGGWECQPGPIAPELSDIESIYQAMMLGLRDYVNKTGFPSVVLHQRAFAGRRQGLRRGDRRALRHRRHRAGDGSLSGDDRAPLRQPQGGRHRGEHPEPRPRRRADGGVQQAGWHGGDDGQQVGDGGGLRHALWRHVRRLQRPEGRLQDDRV